MRYEVLSSIVPSGPYDTYQQAVEAIESYGLKEHKPYVEGSGRVFVASKSDHYWESRYWRAPHLPACPHFAYILEEGTKEVRTIPSWSDELPYMKRRVNDAAERWCTDAGELKRAFNIGALDFSTSYDRAPTCVIGDVWFYFAGDVGEDMTWREYRDVVGLDTILEEVAAILNDPIGGGIDWDESIYALYYIREQLHKAHQRRVEQERLKKQDEWEKERLKKLEGYTDNELMAEINRRKGKED